MSKNDDDKDDISVRCRSGLSDLDLDLCNRQKDEAGTYSLATLLEIRLSFQHYRCETFANCLVSSNEPHSRITSASSTSRQHFGGYQTSSSTHHNLSSLSQAPLSPKDASSRFVCSLQSLGGDTSGDHHYCSDTTKLLPKKAAKSSTSRTDFHVLLSKLTRFRRRHLPAEGVGLFLKNRQKGERGSSDRQPILVGDSFSSSPGSGSISSSCRGASTTEAAATTVDDDRHCSTAVSDTGKVKSTSLFSTGKSKHVHPKQERCSRLGDTVGAHCSVRGEQTNLTGPRSSPSFEITSGPLPNPVNSSSPDCSSSSRTASHLTEAVYIGHIPPNTQVHSSSLSFSNISSSYSSLLKDPSSTHQTITAPLVGTSVGRVSSSPVKHNQLDFRSISEYSFIHAPSISHFIKSDVCSLPIRMDDQITSKMLDSNKSHFGESQSRRMPSYVSISRAISGYSNYNKYSSDLRRDNSLLDSLLSSRGSSGANGGDHHHAQRRPLVDDQVDNFCSLPYEPTQEKVVDPSKSFLQKKIESLYGQTFAEDWKKSRGKSGSSKSNSPTEKTRSPSCPLSRISRDETASGSSSSAHTSIHPPTINSLDNSRDDLCSAEPSTVMSNVIDEKRQQQSHCKENSMECNATQDGHWFLMELNQCKAGIQNHVDRYEFVLSSTEDTIPEEVVGKIRATIGKANLLMNKKLNQFNQLCLDSIAQSEDQEFKINSDDLQGFWDMVTIQVEEVNGAFDDLDVIQQNNWTAVDEKASSEQFKASSRKPSSTASKHNNSNSPRSVSKLVSPMNSPKTSKTASPNGLEREAERKQRLMEIKRKGKIKARERSTEEEITIFMPTSDNDLDK